MRPPSHTAKRGVAIIGSGGYARETLELLHDLASRGSQLQILGFVSNRPPESSLSSTAPYPYLGTDQEFIAHDYPADIVLAIGDPRIRESVATVYEAAGYQSLSLTHPSAAIGKSSRFSRGVIVSAFVCITADVQIGRYVHVDRAAQVGHDCWVGDFVTIHPAATLAGNVTVGKCAVIGTSATILPGVNVGAHSTVGAGAVVTRNVEPGSKVAGVPARVLS